MATTKQKAIAAGFLHALRDPQVFSKWQAAKQDPDKLRGLVKDTMGLDQAPTVDDMNAMKTHAESALKPEHEALLKEQPNAPHAVGFGFTMQS